MAEPAVETQGHNDTVREEQHDDHGSHPSENGGPSPASERQVPVSLALRAPLGPIATTNVWMFLNYGVGSIEYNKLLEQKNQCVRSKLSHRSVVNEFSTRNSARASGFTMSQHQQTRDFPYPNSFRKAAMMQPRTHLNMQSRRVDIEEGAAGTGLGHVEVSRVMEHNWEAAHGQPDRPKGERGAHDLAPGTPPEHEFRARQNTIVFNVSKAWELSLEIWSIAGIGYRSSIEYESRVRPIYVVIGIFPKGQPNPRERVVFVEKPKRLFNELRRGTFRLRGFGSSFFSLRRVSGFRIYKCDHENGTHEQVTLDGDGNSDLQLLLSTYQSWFVPGHVAEAWADWLHHTINNKSHDITEGTYSLELVLGWSIKRISVVVLLPVLVSLGIGLWLNSSAWTDLATIQTAWGTASYVVTAGGLLAALLGIFSSLAEK